MSEKYNLNDNVKDSFQFELNSHVYSMRYPTVEEVEQVQKIVDKYGEESDKITDFIFNFITGDANAPDIKTALKNQNIRVMLNFNEMVKTEFGVV